MGDKLGKVSDKESEQVSDKEESHNKVTRADKVHDKQTLSGQGRETQKITHSGTLPLVHWRIEELVRKIDRCLHSVRTGGEYVDGLSVSQEENTLMDSVCHRTAALAPLRRWEGW